jgi:hypothetical protein
MSLFCQFEEVYCHLFVSLIHSEASHHVTIETIQAYQVNTPALQSESSGFDSQLAG